jgi:hypothetical protein
MLRFIKIYASEWMKFCSGFNLIVRTAIHIRDREINSV